MRKSVRSMPWIDKLCVAIQRRQKQPKRHAPLREQLALNRGKAIGLPRKYPSAWLENRIRDRWQTKVLKITARGECPF